MTSKDNKGDQPRGGETTWTNTGATRYGIGQHKTGQFGDGMLRPSPSHGTQRLPDDDDDDDDNDEYMWFDMHDAICCGLSLFRVFDKIKKTVSTSPGLPYHLHT